MIKVFLSSFYLIWCIYRMTLMFWIFIWLRCLHQSRILCVFISVRRSPLRSQWMVCTESVSTCSGFSLPCSSRSLHTSLTLRHLDGFSLLGFSHLGHWHKINEDTKKTQGSELEGVGDWGVRLLECKIALTAMLLFQHFMASCSAWLFLPIQYLLPSTSFHLFFCPHHTSAEFDLRSEEVVKL